MACGGSPPVGATGGDTGGDTGLPTTGGSPSSSSASVDTGVDTGVPGESSETAPPDPTDPGDTDAGTADGTIRIDAASDLGRMPEVGFNMTYINRGQGLVTEAGGVNATLRESLVTVGTDWLRYPGGTYANLFDWRRAIGPVDERWGFNVFTFQPEQHVFGLDEAAALAEDMGGRLLCVVNINLGAEAAADWVEYTNAAVGTNPNGGIAWAQVRADNGHPAPFGVTHWELANEFGNGRIWQIWDPDDDPLSPGATNIPTTEAVRTSVIEGGARSFENYQGVTRTTWAYDDPALAFTAAPNPIRYTKLAPVVRASVTVRVGPDPDATSTWTMVDSLAGSGPGATHYEFDEQTGEIRFGDGIHGAVPPSGTFAFTDFTTTVYPGLRQYAAAMKAVDPTIQVAGSFSYVDRFVAEDPTIPLDGWQFHVVDNFPVPDYYPDDAHANILSRAAFIDRRLQSTLAAFDTDLRIYGTEIHPWQDGQVDGVNLRNTILGVVGVVASYTATAFRGERVAVVGPNYLTWTGLAPQSVVHPGNAVITAEGWGLRLFREFTGTRRVETSASPPFETTAVEFYTDEAGIEVASQEVPDLLVLASDDDDALFVLVTNTTTDRTVVREIDVAPPFAADQLDRVARITGATPLTTNTPADPLAVSIVDEPLPEVVDGRVTLSFPPLSVTGLRFRRP